jgi:hypothetical protein
MIWMEVFVGRFKASLFSIKVRKVKGAVIPELN